MIGFVLGGGSIRSARQAGVLARLLEEDISPDFITAISGGSMNALLFAQYKALNISNEEIGERICEFWIKNITSPESIVKKRNIIGTGLNVVTGNFKGFLDNTPLVKLIYKTIDPLNVYNSKVKIFAGAVNLENGLIEYKNNRSANFINHCIASAAIPFVFPCVKKEGSVYVDGGLIDSAPLSIAFKQYPDELYCILNTPKYLPKENINPGKLKDVAERVIDISLHNNLSNDIEQALLYNRLLKHEPVQRKRYVDMNIYRPNDKINIKIDNFDSNDIVRMIEQGYNETKII